VTFQGAARVAVVDLAAGSWTVVPGGELRGYEAIAWSPSGRWLYFTGRRLLAWRLGSPRAVRLPVDPGGTVMSIATSDGRL
jgi:sugar lactone lactonase YvrE